MDALAEKLYGDQDVERFWDARRTEEYVISVCIHNQQALAKAMSTLYSQRDFKDPNNAKAFAILENFFESGKDIDPVTIVDGWVDMGAYESGQAQQVAGAWEGDANYEPKISYLSKIGGVRKAQKDIENLWSESKTDTTPEALSQKAFDFAISWNKGFSKKYHTAREVHEMEDTRGEWLGLGIPLLDKVYRNAGLHKGTVKSRMFREKHGKTRSECYECAQHLRQGRTVMYFTLEGQKKDILDNIKQILKDEWREYQDNLLLVDECFTIGEIRSAFIEANFTLGVDVVAVDYVQEVELDINHYVGENERMNKVVRELTQIATKYDVLMDLLSQSTTDRKADRGYANVPHVGDAYGSKQIVRASSMIVIGFRPKNYEELLQEKQIPPRKTGVKDPEGNWAPLSSVFMKPALSRRKLEFQHKWIHFMDTDNGLTLHKQELI